MASGPTLEKTKTPGIYKRGGSYVVTFRDLQGRQRKRFARTLQQARDLKSELRTDVKRREYREEARVSFLDYASEWIVTYQGRTARGLRPATRDDYRQALGLDADGQPADPPFGAVAFFGRRRLAEIEPRDIKRYAEHVRKTRHLSANSVRLALAPVKVLFATAYEEGIIRSNPTCGVRIVVQAAAGESEERKVKALSEDELRDLLDAIRCPRCDKLEEPRPDCAACERWRFFFEFLAHTGLRIGEAVALQWQHVDFGQRRLLVRRRFYRGTIDSPKSKFGRREVPLSTSTGQRLWQLRGTAGDDELVFPSADGTILDQVNLAARVLKPAARRAGVPWVSYHALRHTCATILFRSGLNAKQVQGWLGHHAPSFTLDTYVHLLPEDLPSADFLDGLTAAKGNDVGNTWATSAPDTTGDAPSLIELSSGSEAAAG